MGIKIFKQDEARRGRTCRAARRDSHQLRDWWRTKACL